MKIDVRDKEIVIDDSVITFPASYDDIRSILGEARIVQANDVSNYYIYDDLGITFKEDGEKDVIDILMEETAARTRQREEYFSDYRRYQLMQVDKERVLLACRVIINDLLGKLYRYDYNVGYDCLLDDGNSVSRKLKKSNEEMEVEEDAPCDR